MRRPLLFSQLQIHSRTVGTYFAVSCALGHIEIVPLFSIQDELQAFLSAQRKSLHLWLQWAQYTDPDAINIALES